MSLLQTRQGKLKVDLFTLVNSSDKLPTVSRRDALDALNAYNFGSLLVTAKVTPSGTYTTNGNTTSLGGESSVKLTTTFGSIYNVNQPGFLPACSQVGLLSPRDTDTYYTTLSTSTATTTRTDGPPPRTTQYNACSSANSNFVVPIFGFCKAGRTCKMSFLATFTTNPFAGVTNATNPTIFLAIYTKVPNAKIYYQLPNTPTQDAIAVPEKDVGTLFGATLSMQGWFATASYDSSPNYSSTASLKVETN